LCFHGKHPPNTFRSMIFFFRGVMKRNQDLVKICLQSTICCIWLKPQIVLWQINHPLFKRVPQWHQQICGILLFLPLSNSSVLHQHFLCWFVFKMTTCPFARCVGSRHHHHHQCATSNNQSGNQDFTSAHDSWRQCWDDAHNSPPSDKTQAVWMWKSSRRRKSTSLGLCPHTRALMHWSFLPLAPASTFSVLNTGMPSCSHGTCCEKKSTDHKQRGQLKPQHKGQSDWSSRLRGTCACKHTLNPLCRSGPDSQPTTNKTGERSATSNYVTHLPVITKQLIPSYYY